MTSTSMHTLSTRLAALGEVPPVALAEARVTLHWAAQAVAAFGFSGVPTRDDYSHTTLHWNDEAQVLRSQLQPRTGVHVALHIVDFELWLRRGDQIVERLALDGRGLEEAFAWVGEALERAGAPLPRGVLRPGHMDDMPAHPVGQREPFVAPAPPARAELARWFATADALLRAVVEKIPQMGPVQCWPHHFDTAALHVLDGEGEAMHSVGVGLSPGDGSYAEPYIFVTPWPYPTGELCALSYGHWHTEGWTGAVLRGSELVEQPAAARADRVMEMIRQAHGQSTTRLREQGSEA